MEEINEEEKQTQKKLLPALLELFFAFFRMYPPDRRTEEAETSFCIPQKPGPGGPVQKTGTSPLPAVRGRRIPRPAPWRD